MSPTGDQTNISPVGTATGMFDHRRGGDGKLLHPQGTNSNHPLTKYGHGFATPPTPTLTLGFLSARGL